MGEARRREKQESLQRSRRASPAEVFLIFQSANGFWGSSRPFRQKMAGLSVHAAPQEVTKGDLEMVGEMVASATNLALSVELYLKALRMLSGLPSKKIHNLDKLYAELPLNLRESIEAAYEAAPKPAPTGEAIRINFTTGKNRSPPKSCDPDHSLPSVLARSSLVFETWRYLHEMFEGKVKEPFEFHYLGVAADVLHECVATAVKTIKITRTGRPSVA